MNVHAADINEEAIDERPGESSNFRLYLSVCFIADSDFIVYTRINLGQKNILSVMYNGKYNGNGRKMQNIGGSKAYWRRKKRERERERKKGRFGVKHVCSHIIIH